MRRPPWTWCCPAERSWRWTRPSCWRALPPCWPATRRRRRAIWRISSECAIPDTHKGQIVDGGSSDFEIGRVFSGKTMRSFRNEIIRAWEKSGLDPLPMPYQKILGDDINESVAAAGKWELHSNPAGQGSGLLTSRKPARH